uniref:UDENN domain-containing protein n=1 Tax=Macrostomum lignano TaxID=282301 RepID=A0A1I8F939_9PLAT
AENNDPRCGKDFLQRRSASSARQASRAYPSTGWPTMSDAPGFIQVPEDWQILLTLDQFNFRQSSLLGCQHLSVFGRFPNGVENAERQILRVDVNYPESILSSEDPDASLYQKNPNWAMLRAEGDVPNTLLCVVRLETRKYKKNNFRFFLVTEAEVVRKKKAGAKMFDFELMFTATLKDHLGFKSACRVYLCRVRRAVCNAANFSAGASAATRLPRYCLHPSARCDGRQSCSHIETSAFPGTTIAAWPPAPSAAPSSSDSPSDRPNLLPLPLGSQTPTDASERPGSGSGRTGSTSGASSSGAASTSQPTRRQDSSSVSSGHKAFVAIPTDRRGRRPSAAASPPLTDLEMTSSGSPILGVPQSRRGPEPGRAACQIRPGSPTTTPARCWTPPSRVRYTPAPGNSRLPATPPSARSRRRFFPTPPPPTPGSAAAEGRLHEEEFLIARLFEEESDATGGERLG